MTIAWGMSLESAGLNRGLDLLPGTVRRQEPRMFWRLVRQKTRPRMRKLAHLRDLDLNKETYND